MPICVLRGLRRSDLQPTARLLEHCNANVNSCLFASRQRKYKYHNGAVLNRWVVLRNLPAVLCRTAA